MQLDTFYSDAEDLFDIYYKGYRNRLNQSAWLNGLYNLRAMESAINNVMPHAIGLAMNGGKRKEIKYFDIPIDFEKAEKSTVNEKEVSVEDMIRTENAALDFFK